MRLKEHASLAVNDWRRVTVPVVFMGFLLSPMAQAIQIDTGNPDIRINWTTELRLGLGWRVEGIDSDLGNDPTSHQSDYFAERGDMTKRRLDVLSEFDFIYKDDYGFRVSATGWYDHAYRDDELKGNPMYAGAEAYPNNKMSRQARRYYYGPSGEILDAFVFGRFDLGRVPVQVKAGQHALVWGVSQVNSSDSITWSQQPGNLQKGAEVPGASPKELAMPLPQLSFQAQLSDSVSFSGYYQLDWEPNRQAEGGTFLGAPDFFYGDQGRIFTGVTIPGYGPLYVKQGEIIEPSDKYGNAYGAQLSISPDWMGGGNFGLVYRRLNEMQPWLGLMSFDPTDTMVYSRFHQSYNTGVDLFGVFTNFSWMDISWGAEISHRRGTALDSNSDLIFDNDLTGATGNTWHGLLNAQAPMPNLPLYDFGIVVAEVAYTYLDKVTHNASRFYECNDALDGPGCGTRDASSFSLIVQPTWSQVLPGVDLTGSAILAGYGLHGNSPTLMGSAKRAFAWSLGLTADVDQRYKIGLLYSDAGDSEDRIGAMGSTDRGRINLTFQTSL
ncbi:DUF1302 domain-containing protein [Pseudomonas sp. 5P_3.1_Bac2]|uniref:DUF1302 domain-containing protein n=1 Tax=Pseudomonas sp. 5P_3.1_Bac2 TaxID=2971617 RepID=UPI0021C909EB|nr:DUF1302 domain-containing protein [Pseudomonas sp. 5P_3.1_Bac2]MCU1717664.1 DUF1302 domain-containing protein [Pseudomonas sp. 5P_3.1_Bac2]